MLSVEEVEGKGAFRRFIELPFALFGSDQRWAPPVMQYERARVDGRRNPALAGEARYLLARRGGRLAGRLLVHADGRFGCFDASDEDVAVALLDAAPEATVGPEPFADEQAGVLVAGHDVAGVTGRQWHDPLHPAALLRAGLRPGDPQPTWRLPAVELAPPPAVADRPPPPVAGPYGDPRLVLDGVVAVPDVAAALRSPRPAAAWRLARQARAGAWDTCVVVWVDDDPAGAVPGLVTAAARAGYRWVVAPWAPDERPPETMHGLFRR